MSDDELCELIQTLDDELIAQGAEPWQRELAIESRLSEKLRVSYVIGDTRHQPRHVRLLRRYFEQHYRRKDLFMPPLHVGAFLFRDLFFPVRIPLIFGSPTLDLRTFLVDATDSQKELIFGERTSLMTFCDQVLDLLDFVYGLDDVGKEGKLQERTIELWNLAKQQLEAASATTLGSFTKYAIVQNCCVAVELLLKGVLIQEGVPERLLSSTKRGYGHDLPSMAEKVCHASSGMDFDLVLGAVSRMPDYVHTRYNDVRLTRVQLGHLLMSSHYIAGEILRCHSDRCFRREAHSQTRLYPPNTVK